MNNDLLNKSNLTNSINFMELPTEKLDEYIKLLEEFMNKSEKEGKFVEAELAKQRIIQLNKVKDKKNLKDAKIRHLQEKEELELSQKEELNQFNMEMDKQFYDLSNKFQEMQKQLEQNHEDELKKFQVQMIYLLKRNILIQYPFLRKMYLVLSLLEIILVKVCMRTPIVKVLEEEY